LLPLLFFGIPITVSETLIYDLMLKSGAIFQQGQFLLTNGPALIAIFAICIVIAFFLSWPLAKYCLQLFGLVNRNSIYAFVIALSVATVALTGWSEGKLLTYMLVLGGCSLIGMALRKLDVLPLVFVFVMQNSIESSIHDIIGIYL
jgi:hypothetical protein